MSSNAPSTYNASDPNASLLNVSCLDLLLIEMVPLAERMARRAERLERDGGLGIVGDGEEDKGGGGSGGGGAVGKSGGKKGKNVNRNGDGDEGSGGLGMGVVDGEVYRDAIFFRLDGLGYRVGQGLSERYVWILWSHLTFAAVAVMWSGCAGQIGSLDLLVRERGHGGLGSEEWEICFPSLSHAQGFHFSPTHHHSRSTGTIAPLIKACTDF